MSLNNFLCKYFKDSSEQYVTVAGFIHYLVMYFVVSLVAIFVLVSIVTTVLHLIMGQFGKTTDIFIALLEAIGSIFLVIIFLFVGIVVWERLSTIKLAECPLKKEEKP